MPSSVIDGVDIAWQQVGEGPDLLLVHGLAANRAFWFPQLTQRFTAQFRVTIFDLPGHGYSAMPAHGYSAAAIGRLINGLLDAAGITRTAIIGHSYGGASALEAVCAAPSRYTHLALLDTRITRLQPQMRLHDVEHLTPFEIETAERSRAAFGYDWESETEVGLRFLEAAARLRAQNVETAARDEFTPFGEGRGAGRAAKQWLRLLDSTAASREFREAGCDEATMAALQLPVQLLYAEGSRGERSGRALASLLPQARFSTLDQAGHFFPVAQPQRTYEHLSAFLKA